MDITTQINNHLLQLSENIGYPANRKTITLLQDAVLEIEKLIKDKQRIDWLADIENNIGNVQLPTQCVELHIDDLRAAIDAAMFFIEIHKLLN